MWRIIISLVFGITLSACGGSGGSSGSGGVLPVGDNTDPDRVSSGSGALFVLSNRPDLVSGGDVLIAVLQQNASEFDDLVLFLNGTDISDALEDTSVPNQRLGLPEGSVRFALVEGLALGENTISLNNGDSITVTNFPAGGPVFTGPQIQPWQCQNDAADEFCNEPVEYDWLYKPVSSNELQPYDPNNPPDDVDTANTDNGEMVPFVVRREIGYMARDEYNIYTLFKEDEPWTAAQPQSQWGGQLLVTHGGNCRGFHAAKEVNGDAPDTADYAGTVPATPAVANSYVTALGKGWSVLAVAQLDLGHNCNLSYQAEALMMGKERYIEQHGPLNYTIGTGCSGGAITQNMIANAYPGLYQGLITTCTYPDVMSTATQFADYHILLRFFTDPARAGTLGLSPLQQNLILDHPVGIANANVADSALFAEAVNPESDCGIPEGVGPNFRYNSESNPGGARCDVLTFMGNMIGARQPDRFSENEQAIGEGFIGFPLGNEGVQYGLLPLQNNLITPMQFVELNTRIGGVDTDLNITEERLTPDFPALPNAYRVGILNTITNMDTVPIINATGPDPAIAHDTVHAFWVRYRLDREFGHHDNHVMWGGPAPLIGDLNYMNMALDSMASWLEAISTDRSATPLAEKIVDLKPADVQDQCSTGAGTILLEGDIQDCVPVKAAIFGTPRTAAGDDIFGDQLQCQLRPFSRDDDYGLVPFTEDQWQALEATFAAGVCDWSQRPLDWEPTIPWLTYQDVLGEIITGGEQMPPADFPPGWADPAFYNTWEPGWR